MNRETLHHGSPVPQLILLMVVSLLPHANTAQQSTTGTADYTTLKEFVIREMREQNIPGASLAVIEKGKLV
ncbi:MAG: hypothetical protein AAGA85_20925, partial [Bacteroidota bacterium]